LTPASAYNGYTNKRFNFTIATGGEVSAGSGGEVIINWSDTEGNTGSIIASTTGDYDVYQGVQLTISAGNLSTAETFALDVFNPTLQAAQNDGLARVEQITHAGFVDTNTTAVTSAAGEFTYRCAGIETTVSVDAGTTLAGLVDAINSDTSNPGVTANIINDGQGLATSFHLVLIGNDTGAAQQIELVSETLDNFANDFTTTQEARNAMIKVDGYPAEDDVYLQRSSNRINDLIEGVELKLHDEGTVEVTIVDDKATIAGRIANFVNSVNFVLEYIKKETNYDEDTEENGIMIGNYAFQIVEERIKSIMTSRVPDLTDGVDTYVHLTQIGIHSDPDNDGLFTIDNVALDVALSNDLDAVAKLFIIDTLLDTDGVAELMRAETSALTDSTDGPMNILIENYTGIITNIDKKIEQEERRIILVEARLREQFARLEATLGILNQQQAQLEYQIDQLPGIGKK
ncbi:MAG: flagellar filament capping protein FliD, partial [Deltaproteobacteria bacterium]|nr:flagellar filament capping protein FliD [Deltaproteobacteria bacterium]